MRPNGTELRAFIDTAWPIGLLIAVFVVIDRVVRGIADLGGAGYREPVLLLELLSQQPVLIAGACVGAVVLALRDRSFGPVWPSFDRGWSLRVPVGVIVVELTWAYAFYDYNLWADRLHAFDRLALVAIAGLALWRPVFLAPWAILVSMLAFQFRYPIGIDQLSEVFQLVRITELFVAVVLIRLVTSRWYRSEFMLATLALLASAYWASGIGKLRLGWFSVGPHLDSLFFATYGNGWLGFLSADSASAFGRALGPFLWPLLIAGALVEIGALALLWGRRPLRYWLVAAIAFHLGVFALTGIFFWKWIVFEVALLAFLRRDRLIDHLPIFDLRHAVIATALIIAGPVWAHPVDLSWLDSPVNYVYRFEASSSDGTTQTLAPEFFRPHDYLFTLSPFGYLSTEPVLPVVWGATRDRQTLDALSTADGKAAIFEIEAEFGSAAFDADRAAALDAFLVEFIGNWNRRQSRSSGLSVIGAPPQLWTFASTPDDSPSDDSPSDDRIESVTVWQVMTYWDGDRYEEIRTTKVREIAIPPIADDGQP